MFNIGFGEMAVIAVLGLLIFGPDRLPAAIRSLSGTIRSLRKAAGDATTSLKEASGFDEADTQGLVKDINSLNPRTWGASLLTDEPETSKKSPNPSPQSTPSATPTKPQATSERSSGEKLAVDPDIP